MQCARVCCDALRQHYLRKEARHRFVASLVDTYGMRAATAQRVADRMAQARGVLQRSRETLSSANKRTSDA